MQSFRYESRPATGFYSANVAIDRVSDGLIVHANRVVYGAWIEGTSSRNASTRFKGHHLFRRASQEVSRNLSKIISPEERKLIARLNGGGVSFGPTL